MTRDVEAKGRSFYRDYRVSVGRNKNLTTLGISLVNAGGSLRRQLLVEAHLTKENAAKLARLLTEGL